MNVLLTNTAKQRLREIYEYHKRRGSAKKARQIRIAVHKKILLLLSTPLMGVVEENLVDLNQGHRYLVEGNYKIIYMIIGEAIYITDIFDTRQNPDKIVP